MHSLFDRLLGFQIYGRQNAILRNTTGTNALFFAIMLNQTEFVNLVLGLLNAYVQGNLYFKD